jgi:hypothetical protein
MSAKGWVIGCGTIIVIGVLILVLGGGFVAQRVREARDGIEEAKSRYEQINRDYPYTPPASGALDSDRFRRYLQVRRAVDSAMAPMQERRGFRRLIALTTLPEEVSRVQVDELRQQAMSLDEYRWISRQIYTTVAAEASRPEGDSSLRNLAADFDAAINQRDGERVRVRGPNVVSDGADGPFHTTLLDYEWLRVPEATRNLVRDQAAELARTAAATAADSLLLSTRF